MTEWLFRGDYASTPLNVQVLFLALLLAYTAGQLVAWVYMLTHSGLSYSRSFVNSLVVIPIIVALVMQVLNNSLVTAFGMMAVFAIVRFRNILRDTLDAAYILTVIVTGMACGTMKFSTAMVGCAVMTVVLLFLWYTSFGSRHRYDLIVNLHWARPMTELPALTNLLSRHTLQSLCASQRSSDGFEGTDLSYRVLLRDPNRAEELIRELRDLAGVSRLTSVKAEDESEL